MQWEQFFFHKKFVKLKSKVNQNMENLGFIGMGNMAQALCSGFAKSRKIEREKMFAFAPNQEKLKLNAQKLGFNACSSVKELVEKCSTIVMACKPYQIEDVLKQINLEGKTLISIALGWNFSKYKNYVNTELVHLQFVMPNTPAMVSEGMFLFEKSNSLKEEERKEFIELFAALGTVEELPDNLMGIGGAISGCGPAFVDLFIEAYADAAVKYGIPRTTAYKLVSQTVLGSAKLQLKTGEHPAVLKDNVCSPAGSTICGVTSLEKSGLRTACIESIDAIMNR